MKKELHLFIIWKNAMYKSEEIIKDIRKNFKIRNIYKVIWNDEKWSENLSRFYGTNLPPDSFKEEHCGKDYFLLLIVEDSVCKYDYRTTSHGLEKVNINMFDKKTEYRTLTGGGHKIHATTSEVETNHDLTLLLGKNIEDFTKEVKPSSEIIEYHEDIIGSNGWKSIEEMFYVLNNCDEYVVLRDYENNLAEMYSVPNCDVDMLSRNQLNTAWLLNGRKVYLDNHYQYEVTLLNKRVLFDIKYYGDGYYCDDLENDILKTRKLKSFFYIPNQKLAYKITLLHSLIHKDNFESEYNDRLHQLYPKIHDSNKGKKYYIESLNEWMIDNGYIITVEKENPKKMNINNIKKFDKRCYSSRIFDEIEKAVTLKRIGELEEENRILREQYNRVIYSKGWKLLEKLRKIKNR